MTEVAAPQKSNELVSMLLDPTEFNIKHPLQHSWTLWYDCPSKKVSHTNWHENLKKLITIETVEDFWGVYNNILKPSQITPGSNYHFFKAGIEPMWEDKANEEGGKWTVSTPKNREVLDKFWLDILLFMIGEQFDDAEEINGAVVSVRARGDRIALWTRHCKNKDAQEQVGRQLKTCLNLPPAEPLGYVSHSEAAVNRSAKDMYTV